MKNSLIFLSFSFLAFCVVEGTAWNLQPKPGKPVEETTTDEPTAEPSMATELLSIIEIGLEAITERVKECKALQAKCEEMQREMDEAMEFYKVSRKQNDAVVVLKLVDAILGLDAPCFGGVDDSALENAIFIARDLTGLPNHDKPKPKLEPDPDSKAFQLGKMLADFTVKHFIDPRIGLPLLNNINI